jgi:hypothetical protein
MMGNVDTNMVPMLTAAAATGDAVKFLSSGERTAQFGYAPITQTIVAYGTWDTATVTIQLSPDGGTTWIDTDASFTANGAKNITARAGLLYRAAVATAGTDSITVKAYQ